MLCIESQLDAAVYTLTVYEQLFEELLILPDGPATEAFLKAIGDGIENQKKSVEEFKRMLERAKVLADG